MLKRVLPMVLCIAMLMTMLPVQSFASEAESVAMAEETTASIEETTEAAEETVAPTETEPEGTEPAVTVPAETEAPAVTEAEETVPAGTEEETIPAETVVELTASAEAANAVASGTCGENLTWELDESGTLTVSGTGQMEDYGYSGAPWNNYRSQIYEIVIGDGIASVGNYAFNSCDGLTGITFPDSLTSIGDGAFQNSDGLTGITFPDSLTSIGDYAFYHCDGLTGITFPDSLTSIGDSVFRNCDGLTGITFPENLTSIGSDAFNDCDGLTGIAVPESVTSIGDRAFYHCDGLTGITFPDSLTSIGEHGFSDCHSLTGITFPDSLTSIGEHGFSDCDGLTDVTIPVSVVSIGTEAFSRCGSLTGIWVDPANAAYASDAYGVLFDKTMTTLIQMPGGLTGDYTIPDGVTSIGNCAFSECDGLTGITLPDALTSIGEYAFEDCRALKSITLSDSLTDIGSDAFSNCDLYEIVIPGNVSKMGESCFPGNSNLKKIIFTGDAPEFDESTFDGVPAALFYPANNSTWTNTVLNKTGLPYADLGEIDTFLKCGDDLTWQLNNGTLTISGTGAMYDDSRETPVPWKKIRDKIRTVAFSEGVTYIGAYAFYGCDELRYVEMPASITNIGMFAFEECSRVSNVYISDLRAWCGISFESASSNPAQYAKTLTLNGERLTTLEIPDTVTSIGDYTFYNFTALSSVIIPDSVTSIGDSAFYKCTALSSVIIPDSVTSIGDYMFSKCSGLTSVTIPDSVTGISNYMFYNCAALASVTIPDSVTSIGDSAFYNCAALASVMIPDSVTSIGDSAFYNCTALASVTIPDSVASVGSNTFSGCSALGSVTFPDALTSIGENAFEDCRSLTEVTIPDSVTSIGSNAFEGCVGISRILIPENVTSMGEYIFKEGSSNLKIYCTAASSPEGWSRLWNYNEDGDYRPYALNVYYGYTRMDYEFWSVNLLVGSSFVIPDGITMIPDGTFGGRTLLQEITIPDSVTRIGSGAFYGCTGLKNITIPDSVTSIGASAFYGCTRLSDISVPASVTSIGNSAFNGCIRLSGMVIPEGVTAIGDSLFYGCTYLSSVTIPDSVTSIGNAAFRNCSNLTELTLPASLTSIGSSAFRSCSDLTELILPASVTSIGAYAFSDCTGLSMLIVPEGVDSIGPNTFARCTGLKSVFIPESVKTIEGSSYTYSPFYGCSSDLVIYTGVSSAPGEWSTYWNYYKENATLKVNYNYTLEDYIFWKNADKTVSAFVIPEGITLISDSAFQNNTTLKEITIPASVTQLGKDAFANCSEDLQITYLGTIEQWKCLACDRTATCSDGFCREPFASGSYADTRWILDTNNVLYVAGTGASGSAINNPPWSSYKSYIAKAVIGEGVTTLGESAFSNCSNLTSIEFPSTLTKINSNAFLNCNNIEEVYISDLTAWYHISFGSYTQNPMNSGADLYLNRELVTELVLPDGLTSVKSNVFTGCTSITSVVIPEGVTSISGSAFKGCADLKTVSFPSTLTTIGASAFYGTDLEEVELPKGLESIGESAFRYTNLETVTFPRSVNLISASAFYCCYDLEAIIFRHGASDMLLIGTNAFYEYDDTRTTVKVPAVENAHSAITGYDWEGSRRDVTWESHYCMDDHSVITEGGTLPTCTQPGISGKIWCEVCGKNLGENTEIPALGHTEVIDKAAVAATCTETGLSAQSHCSVCQEILSVQEVVPALGHAEVIDPAVAVTCTASGMTEGKHCEVCHMVLVAQEEIPALGHTEVTDPAVSPTCTETGLTEGSHCETCGEIFTAQEVIPATGHSFEDGTCLVCGALDKADHILAAGKSLTLKVTNPETGKAYTSKQIKWSLPEEYAPYATITAAGKLTAKKVVEKVRVEAIGTIVGDEEIQIIMTADIYPAVTQVEILEGEEVLNGKTVPVDFNEESRTFTVQAYPLDTAQEVTWSISDAKKSAYASYEINGNTLTVTDPTGKSGTVTIKATVNAGAKKTVSFKLNFANFAEKVEITNTEETLVSGSSLQLKAVVTPDNVTKSGVTWSLKNAADKTYASISAKGVLKAKTVYGDTPVTVVATTKDGLKKAEYTVVITPKDTGMLILTLDGENVTKSILNIDLNTEDALSLEAENLADGSAAENITWKSSSNKIATVEDGMVLIHGKGNVTITAEEKVGKKVVRKATVTLKIAALTSSITIEEPDDGLEVASGKAITLKATCEDGANKVTWSIVDGAQYAKITNKGKLTANKDITSAREVTVRATAADGSGVYEEVTVTIRPIAQGVQIYSEEGGRTLFSIRSSDTQWVRSNTTLEWAMNEVETLQLSARVYPCYEEGSRRNAIQGVTWKSSSNKIATVDEDGLVTCIKPGTVTITATAKDGSGKSVSFKLKVINKIESLSMEDQEVKGGKSLNLAKLLEINPTDATYKIFDWEITGGDGAAYASINSKGVLKAKKVKTSMEVEIKATAQDGSGESAEFTVTINPA